MTAKPILVLKMGSTLPAVQAMRGDFEDWIGHWLGIAVADLSVVSPFEGESLPNPDSIAAVVVTGAASMVTERPDWSENSARWLVRIIEGDTVPALGLCYGHQLMAHGLGGEVGPNPLGREMGTVEVRFGDASGSTRGSSSDVHAGLSPLFESGPHWAHMSHYESVLRPPSAARVLAESDLDPNSVLAFGPRQWGVQFHPEFDREIMKGYVHGRRETLLSEKLDPDSMLDALQETPAINGLLGRFKTLVDPSS